MILCDHQIESAIRDGRIIMRPPAEERQYDSSSVILRVGDDFHVWRGGLAESDLRTNVDLDNINLGNIVDLTERLEANRDGVVAIPPRRVILVRTYEYIQLPLKSKLAARVEGRSKQARLGMTAHITAPTIHAGFRGKIVLEIFNHGPFHLEVRPNHSMLCQLVFEEVRAIPQRGGSATYSDQPTPLGNPKRSR